MANEQLTEFNGPSHEANSLEGIPQGPTATVEGNETKQNAADYVYSDRNVIDAELALAHKLPKKYVGKTFADASKLANRPTSKRDGDDIEEQAIARDLDILRTAQEDWKQRELDSDLVMMKEKHPEFMQSMEQNAQDTSQGAPQAIDPNATADPTANTTRLAGGGLLDNTPEEQAVNPLATNTPGVFEQPDYANVNSLANVQKAENTEAGLNATSDAVISKIPGFGQLYGGIKAGADSARGSLGTEVVDPNTGETTKHFASGAGRAADTWLKPEHEYLTENIANKDWGKVGLNLIPGANQALQMFDKNDKVTAKGGGYLKPKPLANGGGITPPTVDPVPLEGMKALNQGQAFAMNPEYAAAWSAQNPNMQMPEDAYLTQSAIDNYNSSGTASGWEAPVKPGTRNPPNPSNWDWRAHAKSLEADPVKVQSAQLKEDARIANANVANTMSPEQLIQYQKERGVGLSASEQIAYDREKFIAANQNTSLAGGGYMEYANGGYTDGEPPITATDQYPQQYNFGQDLNNNPSGNYIPPGAPTYDYEYDGNAEYTDFEEMDDLANEEAGIEKTTTTDPEVTAPEDIDLSPSYGEQALELAPLGYNLGMGLSKAEQLKASDYFDTSSISKGEFDLNPYIQSMGETYAAGIKSLKGSGAGNYYANVRSLSNARNKQMGRVFDAKRSFDTSEQKEYETRKQSQDRYNTNVELSILDSNQKAKAKKRAFLAEAANQGADLAARKGDTRTTKAYLEAVAPDMADRFKYETIEDELKRKAKERKAKKNNTKG